VSRLPDELNAKLYVVGDGPLRSALKTGTDRNVVEFLGQVPYEKMPAVYRAGDVLLLTSRAEGLPRTVLEAMMSGVPVVVSDLDQVGPVVDGCGVTVPVGDINEFTSGIETVLNGSFEDPRTVSTKKFDWADTVERTTEALVELVDGFGR
jgi:glycosyltransferase involved in cell wall biosynthesis